MSEESYEAINEEIQASALEVQKPELDSSGFPET